MVIKNILYYRDQVPNAKRESDATTLEGMIQDYKDWKEAIRNYYLPDLAFKEKHPAYWERLTREITKLEIENVKRDFRKKSRLRFIESLDADEYKLD
ncbi:hypothetical protein FACS1894110_14040 [Spirochaetia bacterium]|nr:hypothetical protein FACS1894110_14040 [Spirochaetia bacterium]